MASFFCPLGDPAAACPDKGLYAPVSQMFQDGAFQGSFVQFYGATKRKHFMF